MRYAFTAQGFLHQLGMLCRGWKAITCLRPAHLCIGASVLHSALQRLEQLCGVCRHSILGLTPKLPKHLEPELGRLIHECLLFAPQMRPSILDVKMRLRAIYEKHCTKHGLDPSNCPVPTSLMPDPPSDEDSEGAEDTDSASTGQALAARAEAADTSLEQGTHTAMDVDPS